ncbi:MAG: HK97 family phage prohead protease [Rhodobacteraceae bacterium]|nr:HK97 family phage prohead protease [Paracoccaceae bacterium]
MNGIEYGALGAGRECKFSSAPFGEIDENGTFSGYASLFGKADLGNDKVARGAFRRSINERKPGGIRMLFQHNPDKPIGVWEDICEDQHGLKVQGRIIKDVANGAEVLNLMRSGALDGLSIGFKTKRSRTDKKTGIREILEADLWEISIVTFPMLPDARVTQVKQISNRLPTVREFERWLTRDAGLTRSQARTVIRKGFSTLAGKQDAAGNFHTALAEKIRQVTQTINARR